MSSSPYTSYLRCDLCHSIDLAWSENTTSPRKTRSKHRDIMIPCQRCRGEYCSNACLEQHRSTDECFEYDVNIDRFLDSIKYIGFESIQSRNDQVQWQAYNKIAQLEQQLFLLITGMSHYEVKTFKNLFPTGTGCFDEEGTQLHRFKDYRVRSLTATEFQSHPTWCGWSVTIERVLKREVVREFLIRKWTSPSYFIPDCQHYGPQALPGDSEMLPTLSVLVEEAINQPHSIDQIIDLALLFVERANRRISSRETAQQCLSVGLDGFLAHDFGNARLYLITAVIIELTCNMGAEKFFQLMAMAQCRTNFGARTPWGTKTINLDIEELQMIARIDSLFHFINHLSCEYRLLEEYRKRITWCECLQIEDPLSPKYDPNRSAASDDIGLSELPRYYSTECLVCQCSALKLIECPGCRCVGYCSKACQDRHWPVHEQYCGRQPHWWGRSLVGIDMPRISLRTIGHLDVPGDAEHGPMMLRRSTSQVDDQERSLDSRRSDSCDYTATDQVQLIVTVPAQTSDAPQNPDGKESAYGVDVSIQDVSENSGAASMKLEARSEGYGPSEQDRESSIDSTESDKQVQSESGHSDTGLDSILSVSACIPPAHEQAHGQDSKSRNQPSSDMSQSALDLEADREEVMDL